MFLLVFSNFSLNTVLKTVLEKKLSLRRTCTECLLEESIFLDVVLDTKLRLKLEEH